MMYLRHLSTAHVGNGTYEVEVLIVDEPKVTRFLAVMPDERRARSFYGMYKQGRTVHGKALAFLKKYSIKEGANA